MYSLYILPSTWSEEICGQIYPEPRLRVVYTCTCTMYVNAPYRVVHIILYAVVVASSNFCKFGVFLLLFVYTLHTLRMFILCFYIHPIPPLYDC